MARIHTRIAIAAAVLLTLSAVLLGGPAGAVRTTTLRLSVAPSARPAGLAKDLNLTPHDLRLVEGGLAIVVLLAVVLVLRIRRRRRETVASAAEPPRNAFPATAEAWRGSGLVEEPTGRLPKFERSEVVIPTLARGWHPVQGDRTRIAFWDGEGWAAYRAWDGQGWVDPLAEHAVTQVALAEDGRMVQAPG